MSSFTHSWSIVDSGNYVKISDSSNVLLYVAKNSLVINKINDDTIQLYTIGKNISFKINAADVADPVSVDADDLITNISSIIYFSFIDYADSLMLGLWDDRGNFDASGGAYPSAGGSGTAGAILKGDIWTISVAGTLPTGQMVEAGDTVRALIDTPGNTQGNWAIAQNNIGYVAENSANKDTVNGYVGLSSWKIKFRNLANTFTSFIQNSATAARTYTFQNRDGTIADDTDLATKITTSALAGASLTVNNAGTTTVTGNGNGFTNLYASSNATSTTIAYSAIANGDTVTIDYLKTTATELAITFPAGTVVSASSQAILSNGNLTATLSSSTSGRFTITIININGVYKVYIVQDIA